MIRTLSIASVLSFAVLSMGAAFAQDNSPAPAAPAAEKKPGPADGFNIHAARLVMGWMGKGLEQILHRGV